MILVVSLIFSQLLPQKSYTGIHDNRFLLCPEPSVSKMSVGYVEFSVSDVTLQNFFKIDCRWSPTINESCFLAASCYSTTLGGTIKILDENGILIEDDDDSAIGSQVPVKPGARVASYEWHPTLPLIAIAWDNGDVGTYVPNRTKAKWVYATNINSHVMQGGMRFLNWISSGKQLVTVDSTCLVTIWKFDESNVQLTTTASYQINDDSNDVMVTKSMNDPWIFIGSSSGIVYHVSVNRAKITEIIQCEFAVRKLLYHDKKSRLIILTNNLMLYQYAVLAWDDVTETSKIKLSGVSRSIGSENVFMEFIDYDLGVVAICITGERVVRLWQLETSQNATIYLNDPTALDNNWSGVTALSYCNNIMAAGTSNSNLMIFKKVSGLEFNKIAQVKIAASIKHICVNESGQVAVSSYDDGLFIVEEQTMCVEFKSGVGISQVGAKQLKIFIKNDNKCDELRLDAPIRGLWMSEDATCFGVKMSGSKSILFYKINHTSLMTELYKPLAIDDPLGNIIIRQDVVYYIRKKNTHLELYAYDLETDDETDFRIPFDDDVPTEDITITFVDVNHGHYIIAFEVKKGKFYYLKLELDRLKISLKQSMAEIETHERIRRGKVNSDGTILAIVDRIGMYSLIIGDNSSRDKKYVMIKNEMKSFFWSKNEPRLICYQESATLVQFLLYNVTDENFKAYDTIEVPQDSQLLGFEVPDIYLLETANDGKQFIGKRSLTEFEGLNIVTTKIMIDFLTSNSVDLNKMIKTINQLGENNQKLWKNLARISVKCRDVEMGLHCVSKMRLARITRDVKQEMSTGSSQTALAVLAINLNLISEAEEILKQANDRTALSNFYQLTNRWDEAIESADRLNLKTVYYNFAKHLESEGSVDEAIKYYELSKTSVYEVPRMIWANSCGDTSRLEEYCCRSSGGDDVKKQNDVSYPDENEKRRRSESESYQLLHWWGMFCESQQMTDDALKAYQQAKDYYNWVRVLCGMGDIEEAKHVLSQNPSQTPKSSTVDDEDFDLNNDHSNSEDADHDESSRYKMTLKGSRDAALLHLGQKLESSNPSESIGYYLSCGAIKHAIRVCKNHGMVNDLVKITVNYGSRDDARDLLVRGYLSSSSHDVPPESLVTLYKKSGQTKKAIEKSLKHRCWSELRDIISELMSGDQDVNESNVVDDSILKLSLECLKDDSDIIDIVIDLLLVSKSNQQLSRIENLLLEYNVEISDSLIEKVEKIQQTKGSSSSLSESLAGMALKQGKYLIAAKLFNSMGDRINSLKSLIRSGQTDRIISYANIARDKLAYKIAANYLQTIDYSDRNVICNFYKKAGAKEELERFKKSVE